MPAPGVSDPFLYGSALGQVGGRAALAAVASCPAAAPALRAERDWGKALVCAGGRDGAWPSRSPAQQSPAPQACRELLKTTTGDGQNGF